MLFKSKKHREIEKRHGAKRNSLKEAVSYLTKVKANIDEVEKGCKDWIEVHPKVQFEIAFNMYVAALKNPKLQQIKQQ